MSRGFRPQSGLSSVPQPLLKDQLNLEHPLAKLSQALDWDELEREFSPSVSSNGGRPPLPTRLLRTCTI